MNTRREFVAGALALGALPMTFGAVPFEVSVRPVEGDATATLQKAFDDCFLAGGGKVVVEKGEYAVKGLRLRSNTTLLLKSGAILKASRNCDDYDILSSDKVEPVPVGDFAPGVVWVTPSKRKTRRSARRTTTSSSAQAAGTTRSYGSSARATCGSSASRDPSSTDATATIPSARSISEAYTVYPSTTRRTASSAATRYATPATGPTTCGARPTSFLRS